MNLLEFIKANRRFLGFGLLAMLLSGFGQTFYIALFGGELRSAFHLSHGEFGFLYSAATLASGITIVWAGRQLDHWDLRVFVVLVALGMTAGCALMGVATAPWMVALAMFVLRLNGQGLLTHMASTTMGRYFHTDRGKAVSVASKGLPLAEALMPPVGAAVITWVGWRNTWLLSALVMAVLCLPLLLWLLKGHGQRRRRFETCLADAKEATADIPQHWNRRQVLRDPRFYTLLPAVLAGPLIVTGMFFHQAHLAEVKGWGLSWLAASFVGFAGAHVVGLLYFGVLADRMGARGLLPFFLLPMTGGLVVVATLSHPMAAWGYMILMGISMGGTGTLLGTLWPELYGVAHLGAIRAVVHAAMVFFTAVTPAGVGWLIDLGVSMTAVAWLFVGYIALSVGMAVGGLRRWQFPRAAFKE